MRIGEHPREYGQGEWCTLDERKGVRVGRGADRGAGAVRPGRSLGPSRGHVKRDGIVPAIIRHVQFEF